MPKTKDTVRLPLSKSEIVKDYRVAYRSRQASVIGRREVLSGKAKFGIFGAGKELVNVAMARHFRKGDWRSGYYRDQTWIFMLDVMSVQEFFSQLYAHADVNYDSNTGGRSMNGHFGNRFINFDGSWKKQVELYNAAADISPTSGQMPRTVGLAYASVLYRGVETLKPFTQFSRNGDEVTWASIGNASTAEGLFWEAINAIGVLKAPAVIAIYDDGYGISVPNEYQMVKGNVGELLEGFRRKPKSNDGYDIYRVKAWDYPALIETFRNASDVARADHVPALVHVTEMTQPLGHSTSGSHERYKSAERMRFEEEFDGIHKMKEWMLEQKIATEKEFEQWENEEHQAVETVRKTAWEDYQKPILEEREEVMDMLDEIAGNSRYASELSRIKEQLAAIPAPLRRDIHSAAHEALRTLRTESNPTKQTLVQWKNAREAENQERYGSLLYDGSAVAVSEVKPVYSDASPTLMGFEIVNAGFDAILARNPRVIAFGEDVGHLGDVNQGFKGMQEKYGALRVTDTGIREATILGQAIGMAMRGLRPICEIQYLDYILFALQTMSDDLSTLHWRTAGGQSAPVIVRTRGHRLEGIWHSGSPMAGIIHLVRGMNVLVPRDMTRAVGFYNTLLQADEPALVVEVLNSYRYKETLPDNLGEFTVPLGVPEVIREGSDITLVTYGACCRFTMEAAQKLSEAGIEAEVIDAQSLLPFDVHGRIVESLKKTNRIVFIDEDVPGGTSAYMMREVIEKQGGYFHLDSPARTLSGQAHRPAAGSDGDYWSKPNVETIFDAAYEVMNEVDPNRYPAIL